MVADGIALHAPPALRPSSPTSEIKAWRNTVKKAGYLNFWNDGAFLLTGAGEGRQRGWRHDRIGAGEVAQVTAGDLILFMSHDDGFHDKEAVPRQPESVLLCDERCPLEPEDDGDTAICDQVKAVWEGRDGKNGEQEKQEIGDEEEEEWRGWGRGDRSKKIIPKVCALVEGTVKPKDVTTATNCNRDSRKHCLFFP